MMPRFIIAVMTALLLLPARSYATSDTYTILGYGTESCGGWTSARATDSPQKFILSAWVTGYITATNAFVVRGNISEGTDIEGINAWIDNYCVAHPLDNLAAAANELIETLIERLPSRPTQKKK